MQTAKRPLTFDFSYTLSWLIIFDWKLQCFVEPLNKNEYMKRNTYTWRGRVSGGECLEFFFNDYFMLQHHLFHSSINEWEEQIQDLRLPNETSWPTRHCGRHYTLALLIAFAHLVVCSYWTLKSFVNKFYLKYVCLYVCLSAFFNLLLINASCWSFFFHVKWMKLLMALRLKTSRSLLNILNWNGS